MRCEIKCHNNCGRWVGWYYPAVTRGDYPEPSMSEGPGEDFTDDHGEWYCSDKCRDEREASAEREPGEQQ